MTADAPKPGDDATLDEVAPTAAAVPADPEPRIKLGDLCAQIGEGFGMTATFISAVLGVEPVGTERRAILYTESQRREILAALVKRIGDVS